MHTLFRLMTVVAVIGFGAGGLAGCGIGSGARFDDDATLSQQVTSIRLDLTSGGVTLHGTAAGAGASIHRSVEYRGARPTALGYRVDGGELVLSGCGDGCAVDYTVDVPAGLPVVGQTSSGSVDLSGVGSVGVSTSSGTITLADVDGPVDVRTDSGGFRGRGLRGGDIRAETADGRIDLEVQTPQDVRATTSDGAITLAVPTARYRVSARTDNGRKSIAVHDDPAGEHRLDLSSANGSITVTGV